jgi:hypothetical protein
MSAVMWTLSRNSLCRKFGMMTASQIIEEIGNLPPEEQAKVVQFAYRLDAERQRTGAELRR